VFFYETGFPRTDPSRSTLSSVAIRSVSFIPKNARRTRRIALRVENNLRMIQLDINSSHDFEDDINYCKLKDWKREIIINCEVALRHVFGKETII